MKNVILCLAAIAALSAGSSCSLFGSQDITYDVDPQELAQNISKDFTAMGTFPVVDCTANAQVCTGMMGTMLPSSASVTCDAGATAGKKQCTLHYDLAVHQTVDLSKQASFPSAITNSSVISLVTVDEVRYWAGSAQKLNIATPPIDIYIGDQNAMSPTDSGVQQLGTIGSIPAMMPPSGAPDCSAAKSGSGTGQDSYCELQLTDTGKQLFATLAKTYQTPFNVILVGHLTLTGGEPLPQGNLDLFLQPVIGFHL
jgi:hypothetical protein